jgi:PIN domain nuclease of toxin-antitoxin system
LLLDSHTIIWAVDDPARLSELATTAIQNPANGLLFSVASVWEIAIKVGLGKLALTLPFRQWMNQAMADLGVTLLPLTVEYADRQAALPLHHRDPFDRLLIAQALTEAISLVSADTAFAPYGVTRLW